MNTKACSNPEMAAAVAGGVTRLVCPPDTDPVLDEPGLVEILKFRAEKLHQSRLFPLGALTRGLAGEVLTEMAELTEDPAAWALARLRCRWPAPRCCNAPCAVRRHLWLHRVLRPQEIHLGRRDQRPAGHAPGACRALPVAAEPLRCTPF